MSSQHRGLVSYSSIDNIAVEYSCLLPAERQPLARAPGTPVVLPSLWTRIQMSRRFGSIAAGAVICKGLFFRVQIALFLCLSKHTREEVAVFCVVLPPCQRVAATRVCYDKKNTSVLSSRRLSPVCLCLGALGVGPGYLRPVTPPPPLCLAGVFFCGQVIPFPRGAKRCSWQSVALRGASLGRPSKLSGRFLFREAGLC